MSDEKFKEEMRKIQMDTLATRYSIIMNRVSHDIVMDGYERRNRKWKKVLYVVWILNITLLVLGSCNG